VPAAAGTPFVGAIDQRGAQVALGVFELPFFRMVTPNVFEPVEVTVRPLTLAFQLFCTLWLPLSPRVTVQLLAPLTV
jgi:hypothetical protein